MEHAAIEATQSCKEIQHSGHWLLPSDTFSPVIIHSRTDKESRLAMHKHFQSVCFVLNWIWFDIQASLTVWDLNESAGSYVWITLPSEDRLSRRASEGNQSFEKKVSGSDHTLILPVKQERQRLSSPRSHSAASCLLFPKNALHTKPVWVSVDRFKWPCTLLQWIKTDEIYSNELKKNSEASF